MMAQSRFEVLSSIAYIKGCYNCDFFIAFLFFPDVKRAFRHPSSNGWKKNTELISFAFLLALALAALC
jgi:hypothetical protein